MKERCLFINLALVFAVVHAISNISSGSANQYPYYNRESWAALPANDTTPLSTPVPYVVIHHTYLPEACRTKKSCSEAMRSMQRYHNSLGWGDIGYNFCLGSNGAVYEGRGWKVTGIHAGPANSVSVGICLIGDWRIKTPPKNMLESTKALIEYGVEKGYITQEYKLVGHNQTKSTECPGEALFEVIKTWNNFSPVFQKPNKTL